MMSGMNVSEAQLALHRKMVDVILSLYEEVTDDDLDGANELAEMIIAALNIEVKSVDGDVASATFDAGDWA